MSVKAFINDLFSRAKGFILPYFAVFPLLFMVVLIISREETHRFINGFHSHFLDGLMKYWTFLGDGLVQALILIIVLFFSFRYYFVLLSAFAFGGLGAQVLKRLFFNRMARPVKYFEINDIDFGLYTVPGVDLHTWHSFPSGHTATAFAVFFAMALLSKSRILQFVAFTLALGVAYSRVYLSQHFLMDVVGGSFLGILMGFLAWSLIMRSKAKWLDLSIKDLFNR